MLEMNFYSMKCSDIPLVFLFSSEEILQLLIFSAK